MAAPTTVRTYIRMEGESTELVEERVKKSFETESFLEALRLEAGLSSGLIPQDCIFFFRKPPTSAESGDDAVYVMEKEPRTVTMHFRNSGASGSGTVHPLKVSLPYCLFFIPVRGGNIQDIWPVCSKQRIKTIDDPIFVLPIPNVYDSGHGRICVGNLRIDNESPIHVRLNKLVSMVFTSEFNLDLTTIYPSVMVKKSGEDPSIFGWAHKSEGNSLFGCSDEVEYLPHNYGTFKGLMGNIGCQL